MALADLVWPTGKDNMSGGRGEVYFCPTEDIDWTTVPTVANHVITTDIVCKTGKEFIIIDTIEGLTSIKSEPQGETDAQYQMHTASFQHAGNEKEKAELTRQLQNTPGVWLFKESDGKVIILGVSLNEDDTPHLDFTARCKTTYNNERGSTRGSSFEVSAESPHDPLQYTGAIQTAPTV